MKKQNFVPGATERQLFEMLAQKLGISLQECLKLIKQENRKQKLGLSSVTAGITLGGTGGHSPLYFDHTDYFDYSRETFINELRKNNRDEYLYKWINIQPTKKEPNLCEDAYDEPLHFMLSGNGVNLSKKDRELLIESLKSGAYDLPKEFEFFPFAIDGANKKRSELTVLPNIVKCFPDRNPELSKTQKLIGTIPMRMLEEKMK